MSRTTASKSASEAPRTRADLRFGTQKYTVTLTGSDLAVVGKATISVDGPALQLNGGWVSLDSTRGVRYDTGSVPPTITTSTSILNEVDAGSVVVPLDSTTLTVIAMPSGLVVDSVTIDTKGFEWVIGQQTLTPEDGGIVVEQAFKKEIYAYRLITVTSGVIPTHTTTSSVTSPSPTTTGYLSPSSSESAYSPTSTTESITTGAVTSGVAEPAAAATITTTAGHGASLRRQKLALMTMVSLFVAILAT